MTRWRFAVGTDRGLVRATNEDAVHADATMAVVADGMGGHAAGEVASAMAVATLVPAFHADESVDGLVRAVQAANAAVHTDARVDPDHAGMGTTLIAMALTADGNGRVVPTICNVGDSRAYQLRDGALRLLSRDHSVVEEWVRMGRLTPEEAAVHPRRHQLTRVLGVGAVVEVDLDSVAAQPGDRILLCSDGLTNELDADRLATLASPPMPLEDAAASLVSAAREAGGHDNISVVLLEFDEVDEAAHPIHRTVATAPEGQQPRARRRRRMRRVTWRSVGAVLLLGAVAAGVVAVFHWYAYASYYLAGDRGVITVYQGQPSGVLWFHPRRILETTYPTAHLRPVDQRALASTIAEPSLDAALNYAAYLNHAWHLSRSSVATATTTTTVVGSTTTSTTTTTVASGKG